MTDDNTPGRRTVLQTAAGIGIGLLGINAMASVEAAPEGTFPEEGDDPLAKIRADRHRYVGRSSTPSTPADGRVVAYVDDGDLP